MRLFAWLCLFFSVCKSWVMWTRGRSNFHKEMTLLNKVKPSDRFGSVICKTILITQYNTVTIIPYESGQIKSNSVNSIISSPISTISNLLIFLLNMSVWSFIYQQIKRRAQTKYVSLLFFSFTVRQQMREEIIPNHGWCKIFCR